MEEGLTLTVNMVRRNILHRGPTRRVQEIKGLAPLLRGVEEVESQDFGLSP